MAGTMNEDVRLSGLDHDSCGRDPEDLGGTFLNAIAGCRACTEPYPHWLLTHALPEEVADGIAELPFAPATIDRYSGKRNTADESRLYFNRETNERFGVCRTVAEALDAPPVRANLEQLCGVDLSASHLRIEYVQDTDGFWLEPHTDISVKSFTMLIYLSRDPQLLDAGTDIYNGARRLVGTVPYAFNEGLIFIPGSDTWHGFEKRTIRGVRKALIVNYVTDAWQDRWELARAA